MYLVVEKQYRSIICIDYFDYFSKTTDLHFFLGTMQVHHYRAPNPFIIIGTFHPKKKDQLELF